MNEPGVADNYRKVYNEGREVLVRTNGIRPFVDYADDVRRRVMVALLPDMASELLLTEEVLTPISNIADQCGLGLCLAGRDFPIHRTVGQAVVEENVYRPTCIKLDQDGDFYRIVTALQWFRINVLDDTLFLGRSGDNAPYESNLMIGATEIPPIVEMAHVAIRLCYSRFPGVQPNMVRDFFHSTLARISRLPDKRRHLDRWREKIQKMAAKMRPIEFAFDRVYAGPMLPFLTGQKQ